MTIQELIKLLENQHTALNSARLTAEILGDVDTVLKIDEKLYETLSTLNALKGL